MFKFLSELFFGKPEQFSYEQKLVFDRNTGGMVDAVDENGRPIYVLVPSPLEMLTGR